MDSETRKRLFAALLQKMLSESDGVKGKLAQKLEVTPQRLTPWLQGKVDPGELGIETFVQIADVKGCSVDELATLLGFFEKKEEKILIKFRKLVQQMLEGISQDRLAENLEISQNTISKWVDRQQNINPNKISAIRMAAIAQEKGWTIERLLIYLGLKEPQHNQKKLFFKLQSGATILSLQEQVKLLAWLSDLVQEKVIQEITIDKAIKLQNNRTICVILEQEDIAIAANYANNLGVHLQTKPENLTIATIQNLPDSLEDIDVLIFDISNANSPSIELIQNIEFDGDIVVFSAIELPKAVTKAIDPLITDVVTKPLDWQQLKNKPYFQ